MCCHCPAVAWGYFHDLDRQLRKVLLRLSQLRFTFTLHGSLSPSVEQVIPEMNAKGAEIARQEWDIILVAVPAERLHIGDPNICLGQPDCSLGFLHFGTSL